MSTEFLLLSEFHQITHSTLHKKYLIAAKKILMGCNNRCIVLNNRHDCQFTADNLVTEKSQYQIYNVCCYV